MILLVRKLAETVTKLNVHYVDKKSCEKLFVFTLLFHLILVHHNRDGQHYKTFLYARHYFKYTFALLHLLFNIFRQFFLIQICQFDRQSEILTFTLFFCGIIFLFYLLRINFYLLNFIKYFQVAVCLYFCLQARYFSFPFLI